MTAVGWVAGALALLLLPRPVAGRDRVAALAAHGRLASAAVVSAVWRVRFPFPRKRILPACCVTVAVPVAVEFGAALAVAASVATMTIAVLAISVARRRSRERVAQQLRAAVGILIAELDAGSRPEAALSAAAEASAQHRVAFDTAATAARAGRDPAAALLTNPDLVPLAHAWRVADRTGSALAAVLSRVGLDLAARARQVGEVSSALAGARSSAGLLALLPALGLLLGAAMGARPLAFLIGAGPGRLLCLVGVLLDAGGVLWTHRLMSRAEPT